MKYKNTKTGAIIETSTEVSGENWGPFDDEESEEKKTPATKQKANKAEGDSKDDAQEGTE